MTDTKAPKKKATPKKIDPLELVSKTIEILNEQTACRENRQAITYLLAAKGRLEIKQRNQKD